MPKLLIVDDDAEIIKRTIEFFELEGWAVTGAANGEQALALLDPTFDAVVLDLRMPVMDGQTTLIQIRERAGLDSICAVILTAFGEVNTAVQALRQGAYQYLEKPFDLYDLKRILISGIVLQKAHALRRSLLSTRDLNATLDRIRSILREAVLPCELYFVFLNPDDPLARAMGGQRVPPGIERRRFVTQVVETRRAFCDSGLGSVREWEPVNPEARSILAAPVPANDGAVTAVLHAESTLPEAFDHNWVEVVGYLSDLVGISLELIAKQQLLVERKHWEQLPTTVNELRHHISTPAQTIALQVREFAAKELKSPHISKLPEGLVKGMSRRMNIIRRNADSIKRVCSYLQDVSNDIPIDIRRFNLMPVINTCAVEVKTQIQKSNIRLTVSGKKKGGLMLEADPNLLKYCIQCLLGNAIEAIEEKHRQDLRTDFDAAKTGDRIVIRIDENPGQVMVSVEDTGVGVQSENRARVFQPLFSTKQREASGGMGLFSVKRIMNKHGGAASFESQPGKGATFTLSFPRK